MRELYISDNSNGRLLQSAFATIAPRENGKWDENEVYSVNFRGTIIGTARLYYRSSFPAMNLKESHTYLVAGMDLFAFKKLFKTEYGALDAESFLFLLIFKWESQDLTQMSILFKNQWEKMVTKKEEQIQLNFL
jgi:hypothetical protein